MDLRATHGLALGITEKKHGIYYSTLGLYKDNEKEKKETATRVLYRVEGLGHSKALCHKLETS